MEDNIKAADFLEEAVKEMIFSELSAVPESNTFIHGDFHPGVLSPMLV